MWPVSITGTRIRLFPLLVLGLNFSATHVERHYAALQIANLDRADNRNGFDHENSIECRHSRRDLGREHQPSSWFVQLGWRQGGNYKLCQHFPLHVRIV